MIQNEFEWTSEDKVRSVTRAEETLICLRNRPMNTIELQKVVGPRPAAYVKQLRLRGYQIESRKEGNVALYELKGFVAQVEVTDEMRTRYYSTNHWRLKRVERLMFDDYRCCNCKSGEDLQVHHWHYDLFNESVADLITFCNDCHERVHQYPNVQVHFPRFLSPEIALRLE